MAKDGLFQVVKADADVATTVSSLMQSKTGNNQWADFIVFRARTDMPDSEAIFYYIRNALAHGSFEIISAPHGRVLYKFECKKDNIVKARIQLKEKTLLRIKKIASMSSQEIRAMRRK